MFNKIIVATSIALLAGCVPMQNQYNKPSYSSYVPPKPKVEFSGWDDNGKLKTKSSIQGTPQISGKTILNEDAIVCESNEILLKKAENLSKYPTGTLFMEELDGDLKIISRERSELFSSLMDRAGASFDSISSGNKLNQIENSIRNAESHSKYDNDTKRLDDSYANTKRMMNTCAVNKTPLPIEVVERKPISKMAKIKWNGAEVWTYESHLTFKNQPFQGVYFCSFKSIG
jgi:hypothetical protein